MSLFLAQVRKLNTMGRPIPDAFPGKITAEITLGPEDAFGLPSEQRSTVGKGEAKFTYIAEEGGISISGAMIQKVKTEIQAGNLEGTFDGNVVTVRFFSPSLSEAYKVLTSLTQIFIPIISHQLSAYVWVKGFKVRIGNECFDYILGASHRPMVNTTSDDNSNRLRNSFARWMSVEEQHRPFFNAVLYFRQAQRLACLQPCPEPMISEIILNLAKTIDVLFRTDSNDKLRDKAKSWGLDEEEIKELIVPIRLLRSKMDVAHIALSPLAFDDRQTVMDFAIEALGNMEGFLDRVWESILAKRICLEPISESVEKEKTDLLRDISQYLDNSRRRRNGHGRLLCLSVHGVPG